MDTSWLRSNWLILFLFFFFIWITSRPAAHNIEYTKIYYLHLDRISERKKSIQNQILKHNLTNAVIFPGVDGKKLNKKKCSKLFTPKSMKWIQRGQIGCAMGHVNILKHIVDSNDNHPFYLILEDDALLASIG
jgi:GR25 family glycosyltransferase involved in LPS biosynthesis